MGIILAVISGWVSGGVFLKNGSDVPDNVSLSTVLGDNPGPTDCTIGFFYNRNCGACHVAMAYLTEYNAAHPEVRINSYDLFNSTVNRDLFEQYKKEYNRTYVPVPSVFAGDIGLEGEAAIRENFDLLVSRCDKNRNASVDIPVSEPGAGVKTHRTVISIPLVLIAGFIDGINPCAVAVLIFLLILLMTIRQRQRIIPAGIVFASAVLLFYFLAGAGIFPLAGTSVVVKAFSLVAGVLAILTAILFILMALFPGKDTGDRIPGSGREKICITCEKFAIPASFICGLLLGVLELPCAGGIYITILDMIAFRVNIAQGLVYLILYNLAFIIPLLLMTGIVFLLTRPGETGGEAQNSENKRGLRIFSGLLLLVFAFLILSGIL